MSNDSFELHYPAGERQRRFAALEAMRLHAILAAKRGEAPRILASGLAAIANSSRDLGGLTLCDPPADLILGFDALGFDWQSLGIAFSTSQPSESP
jgi:hypothetical protein